MKVFFQTLLGSTKDLLPIVAVVLFFQLGVLQKPLPEVTQIAMGLALVVLGLTLFVYGLELALFPLGESMAHAFANKGNLWLLLGFAFFLGFGTTIAEPALIAVAQKSAVIAADSGVIAQSGKAIDDYAFALRLTVAFSVGAAILIGVMRIIRGWPLDKMIMGGYLLVLIMTLFAPAEIIGIAYDSGGVTTSTITVPLVTALGVGLSSAIKGRNPMLDGFGLIAFASLLPMIFVIGFGLVY